MSFKNKLVTKQQVMSFKNKLQEYYQRTTKGVEMPMYDTVQVGGSAHNPVWVSTVILPDGSMHKGDESQGKKATEISAAEKALKYLSNGETDSTTFRTFKSETYIYLDVENQPVASKRLIASLQNSKNVKNAVFTFVLSRSFAPADQYASEIRALDLNCVHLCYVKDSAGTLSNSADTAISILTSRVPKNNQIIILSADKFASVLASVKNYLDNNNNCKVMVSEKEFFEYLEI